MKKISDWEVIQATGGYYFVTNGKQRFAFWGREDGRYEAIELAAFLNNQNKELRKLYDRVQKSVATQK